MTKETKHTDEEPIDAPEQTTPEQEPIVDAAAPDAAPAMTADEAMAGWQRCMADFDNYKKRQQENAKEERVWAARAVVEDLLPVVDNFHAATDHVPADHDGSPWVTGILYIRQQLEKVLSDHGVTEIAIAPGDAFDPATMEAIQTHNEEGGVQSNDQPATDNQQLSSVPHAVAKVMTRGYKMGERVIRAARVAVN